MKNINGLNEAIQEWDKMEGASSVFYMFGWNKKKEEPTKEDEEINEDKEDEDYRNRTQGERNSKHLVKARIYANTPQARLKKERTLYRKELES